MSTLKHSLKGGKGFSLLEVVVSLGITSFCLITLLALLPLGIASNQASLSQTAATSIAAAIASDLRVSYENGGESPRFKFKVPDRRGSQMDESNPMVLFFWDDGLSVGSIGDDAKLLARYRANVWLIPSSEEVGAMTARIFITWPAQADPSANKMPERFSGSLELITAFIHEKNDENL